MLRERNLTDNRGTTSMVFPIKTDQLGSREEYGADPTGIVQRCGTIVVEFQIKSHFRPAAYPLDLTICPHA